MNKPKVTVVVPIYNVEKYVEKCLKSLISQTFNDIEILAISDGSPDNSGNIVNMYKKKDNRIKYIEKENGGYGSVLEYAIKNTKTEYLLVCDPDDWLEPNAIEILYENANNNNLDITIGEKYLIYNDGEKKISKNINHFYNIKNNYVYTGHEIEKISFCPQSPHSKLFRTKCLKNIIFPYNVSYTDNNLFILALKYSKRVMLIDKPLAYYLIERPGNTMTDKKPKAVMDRIVMWNYIFNQINNNDEFIIYWLYKNFKYFSKVYYTNSNNFMYDDIFDELLKSRKRLLPYYKRIRKNFTKGIFAKIEIDLIMHGEATYKSYLKIRRILKKWDIF